MQSLSNATVPRNAVPQVLTGRVVIRWVVGRTDTVLARHKLVRKTAGVRSRVPESSLRIMSLCEVAAACIIRQQLYRYVVQASFGIRNRANVQLSSKVCLQ